MVVPGDNEKLTGGKADEENKGLEMVSESEERLEVLESGDLPGREAIQEELIQAVQFFPQVDVLNIAWLHTLKNAIGYVPDYVMSFSRRIPQARETIERDLLEGVSFTDFVDSMDAGDEGYETGLFFADLFKKLEGDFLRLENLVVEVRVLVELIYRLSAWFATPPYKRIETRDTMVSSFEEWAARIGEIEELNVHLGRIFQLLGALTSLVGSDDEVKEQLNSLNDYAVRVVDDSWTYLNSEWDGLSEKIQDLNLFLLQTLVDSGFGEYEAKEYVTQVLGKVLENSVLFSGALTKCSGILKSLMKEEVSESVNLFEFFDDLANHSAFSVLFEELSKDLTLPLSKSVFGRMLDDLIDNARKAKHDAATEVKVEVRAVYDRSSGRVVVEIWDDGKGMDTETMEKINRGEVVSSRGGGMGLKDARDVLRSIEGRLMVDSTVNIGTTVTIHFPVGLVEVESD